jgi:pyruvate dehydrogenase complex dehydrogenase (E1) component
MNALLDTDSHIAANDENQTDWQEERREWLASMAYILEEYGPEGAQAIFQDLYDFLQRRRAAPPPVLNTPYRNTILIPT